MAPTQKWFWPFHCFQLKINFITSIFFCGCSQMEAFYVSMILFVSRAWDAVTDPLVGYLVSRSKWTPIGKLTPWLVGGATHNTHFILNLSMIASSGAVFSISVCLTGWCFPLHLVSCPICCCGLCLKASRLRLPVCCGSSQQPVCSRLSWL